MQNKCGRRKHNFFWCGTTLFKFTVLEVPVPVSGFWCVKWPCKGGPLHPMGGISQGSLAGRRTEALRRKVWAKATHFTRWNERDSGNDYLLTLGSDYFFF